MNFRISCLVFFGFFKELLIVHSLFLILRELFCFNFVFFQDYDNDILQKSNSI